MENTTPLPPCQCRYCQYITDPAPPLFVNNRQHLPDPLPPLSVIVLIYRTRSPHLSVIVRIS